MNMETNLLEHLLNRNIGLIDELEQSCRIWTVLSSPVFGLAARDRAMLEVDDELLDLVAGGNGAGIDPNGRPK